MQKWWSVFFGVVLLAELILCAVAPLMGWWLPANIASYGGDVDLLFYLILGLTGFFFVLTEAILVYTMYTYAARPGAKSLYSEGNSKLELAWTVVPGAILLFIAFTQIKTWEEIKYQSSFAKEPDQMVQVTARQWEWRMRYANDKKPDGKLSFVSANPNGWKESPEFDDYHGVNELHTWEGANVRIYLKTQDVIHSFFLPNLRLKQDALPGKTIPMWFKTTPGSANVEFVDGELKPVAGKEWEIACAELCGGSHYRMRGRLFVHKSKKDFEEWFQHAQELERSRKPETRTEKAATE